MTAAPFPIFETFATHQGETFTTNGIVLTLTTATTWGQPFEAGARQPFTLHFLGPVEPWLPQSMYHLEHAVIGDIDLFLVPLGPTASGMRYESVFA